MKWNSIPLLFYCVRSQVWPPYELGYKFTFLHYQENFGGQVWNAGLQQGKTKQNKNEQTNKSLLLTSGRLTQLRKKQADCTKFKALVSNEYILAWIDLLPHSMNGWMGLDLPTELRDKQFLVVFLQSKSTGMILKRITHVG